MNKTIAATITIFYFGILIGAVVGVAAGVAVLVFRFIVS